MKIREIETWEGVECLQEEYEDREVLDGYTSDLLSDVMANAAEGAVLITIQAHKNTVAVASLAGLAAIIVCGGRPVDDPTLEAARREGIAVFRTAANQFRVSARVARALGAAPDR